MLRPFSRFSFPIARQRADISWREKFWIAEISHALKVSGTDISSRKTNVPTVCRGKKPNTQYAKKYNTSVSTCYIQSGSIFFILIFDKARISSIEFIRTESREIRCQMRQLVLSPTLQVKRAYSTGFVAQSRLLGRVSRWNEAVGWYLSQDLYMHTQD